jgi:hypothetical protein
MFRPAVAFAALVVLAAAPIPSEPGISFTIKSTTSTNGTVTKPSGEGTRVQALNGILRFEGEDSKQSSGGKGSYVIVNPAAKTLSMVMPDSRQYIEINWADSTGQALGAMASMMAATTVVSDIQVSGSSLGSGGSVNGYNTSRYRINTSFAEAPGGSGVQRKMKMVEEFWVTTDLKDVPDPMEAFTRAFGGQNGMPQMAGTMADLMKKRGDAQRKLFSGLPIKSVVKTTATEADGSTKEETSVTEIVDLKKIAVDPSTFRVPAGYEKMDMKSFMNVGNQFRNALRGAGGKSGGSASGKGEETSAADEVANAAKDQAKEAVDETKQETKDAAKDAAKGGVDAAKDKAKCKLGGLFGKKC